MWRAKRDNIWALAVGSETASRRHRVSVVAMTHANGCLGDTLGEMGGGAGKLFPRPLTLNRHVDLDLAGGKKAAKLAVASAHCTLHCMSNLVREQCHELGVVVKGALEATRQKVRVPRHGTFPNCTPIARDHTNHNIS